MVKNKIAKSFFFNFFLLQQISRLFQSDDQDGFFDFFFFGVAAVFDGVDALQGWRSPVDVSRFLFLVVSLVFDVALVAESPGDDGLDFEALLARLGGVLSDRLAVQRLLRLLVLNVAGVAEKASSVVAQLAALVADDLDSGLLRLNR